MFVLCSGPIPEALGSLVNLAELNLEKNKLTGEPVFLLFEVVHLLVPPSLWFTSGTPQVAPGEKARRVQLTRLLQGG